MAPVSSIDRGLLCETHGPSFPVLWVKNKSQNWCAMEAAICKQMSRTILLSRDAIGLLRDLKREVSLS